MTRQKGFRPTAIAELRRMNANLKRMLQTWGSPPNLRWYADTDGPYAGIPRYQVKLRKRADIPASEYQENQREQLERLIKYMQVMESDAYDVHRLAAARLAELEREGK